VAPRIENGQLMAIPRHVLREAAQLALRQHGYEVELRSAPGAAPGARLTAVKGETKLSVAVRTSQRRDVGLVRAETGRWKTVTRVDLVLVAVPSKPSKSSDRIEVVCFDSKTLMKAFDDHTHKLDFTIEPEVPVFVPLDAVRSKGSNAEVSGLNASALWCDEFEVNELGRQSKARQLDQFIARVTRDFADLLGIDAERVIVDFRISSKT
jgi:hypothetical protein